MRHVVDLVCLICLGFCLCYVQSLVCVVCSFQSVRCSVCSHETLRFAPSMPRFARQARAQLGPKGRYLVGPNGGVHQGSKAPRAKTSAWRHPLLDSKPVPLMYMWRGLLLVVSLVCRKQRKLCEGGKIE